MQIVANLENNEHFELVKMLFKQLNISFFVESEEEDDEELLALYDAHKDDKVESWEDVKKQLNIS
jgi:hypothetical protein